MVLGSWAVLGFLFETDSPRKNFAPRRESLADLMSSGWRIGAFLINISEAPGSETAI